MVNESLNYSLLISNSSLFCTQTDKHKADNLSSNQWILSHKDRDENLVISNDGFSCQSKDTKQWQGVRSNRGTNKDNKSKNNKFYYEVYFSKPGLARVGWAMSGASLDLGTDKLGFGFGGTGKKSNSRNFEDYGTTFGDRGDVIGNLIDFDAEIISWCKNGEYLGEAFRIPRNFLDQIFYPCVCTKNASVSVRFGLHSDCKLNKLKRF